MARPARNNGHARAAAPAKYDAHHNVLNKAYGAFADLRRELSDTKQSVAERSDLLNLFAGCADSQRAWLLLEDYFEKLSLARKDFPGQTWWPRLMNAKGKERLEETALLFLRNNRPLPTELMPHANLERFAEIEQAEEEQKFVQQLEEWLLPRAQSHLDAPRACMRVTCQIVPLENQPTLHALKVQFHLFRPRAGEKLKTPAEVIDLTTRAAHEHELFPPNDWEFIEWLSRVYADGAPSGESILLTGIDLLQWLARWGHGSRMELAGSGHLQFRGEMLSFAAHLAKDTEELAFTQQLQTPDGKSRPLTDAKFFGGLPQLALLDNTAYLLRNSPPQELLAAWIPKPFLPVRKLSHRLLTHLSRSHGKRSDWEQLCKAHTAIPQFVFELNDDTVRLRLVATSDLDKSEWQWSGHEWQMISDRKAPNGKPEILDDPRLDPAVEWLRRLDWFTPEPGLWVGDANEAFLSTLAHAWPDRPETAEYLGNPSFHRLFLAPRQLKPRLIVQGSGIDWFAVSTNWEIEGMKLTPADLERLQSATGRFVKLPDSGWMELDEAAVQSAHETFADLGLDGLSPVAQRVDLLHATHLDEATINKFSEQPFAKALRERVKEFKGVPVTELPDTIKADLRPYQKDGFDFLCHLSQIKLGGILADDMGLGKTLQTLSWISWLLAQNAGRPRPALVICPASVLHNWRRESNRFVPHLRVLVLESGAARHNLRKQIPEHDLIVTNYALLRRDLTALQKFDFQAIVLDEAQFIKNPSAQVTQSVKQLKASQRLALTGTPLENRMLDLWSIVDFVQPGYLGSQADFQQHYEPKSEDINTQKIARRRLSAKLRPLMLRRLKKQVAKDLPDRIEERRDCVLSDDQRKLYLAELRRSREQIMQTVAQHGVGKSKIHVLAALTRLRQICCHPQLVGNDTPSGKTETLFELLEPLLAQGQKVLVFSQFVQMLKLIEAECKTRQMPTHILTGETKDRQEVVNGFQNDPNASVFLLSLRAAGTGLNLTTASYVVLYDPWWNPAVEAQAIDRSHRIGQTRTVNAYRLITPGTVEEKIWDLQQRKAQTIVDVLGEEGFARSLTKSDLEYLFSED
jgi:hypothetical protein